MRYTDVVKMLKQASPSMTPPATRVNEGNGVNTETSAGDYFANQQKRNEHDPVYLKQKYFSGTGNPMIDRIHKRMADGIWNAYPQLRSAGTMQPRTQNIYTNSDLVRDMKNSWGSPFKGLGKLFNGAFGK